MSTRIRSQKSVKTKKIFHTPGSLQLDHLCSDDIRTSVVARLPCRASSNIVKVRGDLAFSYDKGYWLAWHEGTEYCKLDEMCTLAAIPTGVDILFSARALRRRLRGKRVERVQVMVQEFYSEQRIGYLLIVPSDVCSLAHSLAIPYGARVADLGITTTQLYLQQAENKRKMNSYPRV